MYFRELESEVKVKAALCVSDSLLPRGLFSSWNSPGQKTGVGSLSLLQAIFPTHGSNPGLPHCRQIPYQLSLCSRVLLKQKGSETASDIDSRRGMESAPLASLRREVIWFSN